jgi:hypothetical protein
MIRYLELTSPSGGRLLIRADAIRIVEEKGGVCYLNVDTGVMESYSKVKELLASDDSRQIVDYSWPPALLHLARNRVCDYVKAIGPERALELVRSVAGCTTEEDVMGVLKAQLWRGDEPQEG